MRQPTNNTAKLPQNLLDELGIADGYGGSGSHGKRNRTVPRKERRKAARSQKKTRELPSRKSLRPEQHSSDTKRETKIVDVSPPRSSKEQTNTLSKQRKPLRSILKTTRNNAASNQMPKERDKLSLSSPLRPNISQGTKDQLLADDSEIAALEKALGLKRSGTLTKAFKEDCLDTLVDGLYDPHDDDVSSAKRKRTEGETWLERKRRKASADRSPDLTVNMGTVSATGSEDLSDTGTDDSFSISENIDEVDESGFSSERSSVTALQPRKARENPYRAPLTPANYAQPSKYVPPSLRADDPSFAEDSSFLRRQLQGLLNRLSEANLVTILGDIERLYQNNARQHVSTVLLDLLMGLLSDPTSLPDTFIILYGGFIAAIYKIIGTGFGAQVIQRIDQEFVENYPSEVKLGSNGKRSANLISLLAEMYNFQVIGSNLIYDYIRILLEDMSETSAELVLKIVRNSGPQLRQDDASSLKDIVLLLQSSIAKKGEENLSVRTIFMIETINNLKNNRMKTGIAASNIASEHTIRMKKTLGALNVRSVQASEPLRIGVRDLRDSDKRGKWWLVGPSYKGEDHDHIEEASANPNRGSERTSNELILMADPSTTDLVQLAREQRMNTDVRRSIFIAIMSSTDYKDAHLRLQKLRLKKAQELEIPKVLLHCAAAETTYNPFYSLLARRLCSDRKLKMAFQFSLWDLLKGMGEGQDDGREEESDDEQNDNTKLSLRGLVNLAKLFGTLISEGGLTLTVLKTLNFAYVRPKTKTFTELLLITVILSSQGRSEIGGSEDKKSRDEKAIMETFLLCKDVPALASGLQYFMKRVVSKTDVAGSRDDFETVKWGCKVASDALRALTSSMVTED